MAHCIQEQIVAWVKTKLAELVSAGTLIAVERPVRDGLPSNVRHGLLALYQDDPAEIEATHGAAYWNLPLACLLFAKPADGSTTAVDTTLNDLRAHVEKKLMEDTTCGGLAHLVTIRAPEHFAHARGDWEGVIVNVEIQFGTLESDPFTQV